MTRKLLIASSNKGKIIETKEHFKELDFEFVTPDNFDNLEEVIEDGQTLEENALKKARDRANKTNLLSLADDTGLEVDYLDGKPGIRSARFAHEDATYKENNDRLLELLKGVPFNDRKAQFRTVVAVVDPKENKEYTVSGYCKGYILKERQGERGFGYDPLFYVPEYDKTFAEMSVNLKNKISHRAHALEKMKKVLKSRYAE
ncbi:MAG: XTP/dITP diphosphatase [Halanaerobiales bacterium]|nr:XTP/dITP diphosphatase [Halanaerobiales bacterium]